MEQQSWDAKNAVSGGTVPARGDEGGGIEAHVRAADCKRPLLLQQGDPEQQNGVRALVLEQADAVQRKRISAFVCRYYNHPGAGKLRSVPSWVGRSDGDLSCRSRRALHRMLLRLQSC